MYEYISLYQSLYPHYRQQNFPEYFIAYSWYLTSKVVRENSRYFAKPPLMAPEERLQKFHTEDVSLPRSAKCFWLIGCAVIEICFNQSEPLPRSGYWRIISMKFQQWHRCSGIILWGNLWWWRDISAVFSVYTYGNDTKLTVLPVWPPWAAQWRGVEPDLSRPLTDTCQVIK